MIACRSGASGVVIVEWSIWTGSPPTRNPSVPMLPTRCAAASSAEASISTVVDLPLVPVTPKLVILRAGWPHTLAEAIAIT